MRSRMLSALALAAMVAFASAAPAAAHSKKHKDKPKTEEIQLVNVSDWHAQLDPLNGVGGAAALSTYFKQERAANPNTLVLTAGDAYGAAPLSGFFDEEPAVKAMNLMGFDADTFGNHNFDRGTAHLRRMIDLAQFPYIVSNLLHTSRNGLDGVRRFEVFDVGGVKVGLVGLVNPEAPTLVFPGNFGTLAFDDTRRAVAKARADAKRKGAKVVVLFGHFGVTS